MDICIYHSGDLDGKCSAAIARNLWPGIELVGIDYGEELNMSEMRGKEILMVDFALQPFGLMFRLAELAKRLLWVDHHKSAHETYLEQRQRERAHISAVYADGKAACEILWETQTGKPMPVAVTYLGRYDVWDHKAWDWQEILDFQYGMRSVSNEPDSPIWASLLAEGDSEDLVDQIEMRGQIVRRYCEVEAKSYMKAAAFPVTFEGYTAIAVNRGIINSQFFKGYELYELMIPFWYKNGKFTVSLYTTRDDIDCAEIAGRYGGGGHRKAAGFQTDNLPWEGEDE